MTLELESDLVALQKGAEHAPLIVAAAFEAGSNRDCILAVPEIIYLAEGEGTLTFDDGSMVDISMGYLYIIAPCKFAFQVKESIRMILCRVVEEPSISFNDSFEDFEIKPRESNLPYAAIEANVLLRHFYDGMFLYLEHGLDEEELLKAKITELFLIIRQSHRKCDYARFLSPLLSKEYLFKMFVCKYAASVSSVAQLAELTNMSPRMLNNRFREYMDISPKEFIHHARMKSIKQRILDANVPIKNIAFDYGISVQYLSYLCKKEFGMTPTEMRTELVGIAQEAY